MLGIAPEKQGRNSRNKRMDAKLFHMECWKRTALGSAIELWASHDLSNASFASQRPILLMGGVHGDEPEGVRLAQDTLTWLKSHSSDSAAATREPLTPWVLVPCLNVDGFNRNTRVNGRGVDLNRNYPSRDWSAEAKAERYYPGPSPASEPEIQGVVELLSLLQPRLVIHCHSWKPCIVATGPKAVKDAERLTKNSGYELMPEIGYPTPGSLSRYGWHDKQIPIICIEEQDQLADLNSIWPRFSRAMKEIFTDSSLREVEAGLP
jgi:hypothetical protein